MLVFCMHVYQQGDPCMIMALQTQGQVLYHHPCRRGSSICMGHIQRCPGKSRSCWSAGIPSCWRLPFPASLATYGFLAQSASCVQGPCAATTLATFLHDISSKICSLAVTTVCANLQVLSCKLASLSKPISWK